MNSYSLNSLTHATDMQNCLVASLNVRVVVQNLDLSVEVLYAEGLVGVGALGLCSHWVDQARSFSDLVVLDSLSILSDSLDVHADGSHLACLLDWYTVLVDALDRDRAEISVAVRTEHHLLVDLDATTEDGTTQDQAYTSANELGVHNELGGDISLSGCLNHIIISKALDAILLGH